MLAVLGAVAVRLDAAGIPWRLAGSTARLVRGMPVRPSDIDVEVAEPDGPRAARALGLPVPRQESGGGWSSLRSQGAINGVPIDLSAGLTVTGPGGTLTPIDASAGESVTVTEMAVPGIAKSVGIVHPGEALARAIVSGSDERRATALAGLPDDPAERAAALAYCDARVAAAASAAR